MDAKKNSVLVIDDEMQNLKLLNLILKKDYTVYLVKDGKTGIEMAVKHQPDIILLDIVMPDMDGYEVLSVLKASPETKNIPVIFVTGLDISGNGTKEEIEKGLALGAAEFIGKPLVAEIVRLRVRNLLYVNNMPPSD
jgi:response regulator RpfG family c-di-GMP phosphodiesterase